MPDETQQADRLVPIRASLVEVLRDYLAEERRGVEEVPVAALTVDHAERRAALSADLDELDEALDHSPVEGSIEARLAAALRACREAEADDARRAVWSALGAFYAFERRILDQLDRIRSALETVPS